MSEATVTIRLSKAAREFNIGVSTIVDFLEKRGFSVGKDPNTKLSQEIYALLMKEFATEKHVKEEAQKIGLQFTQHETITIEDKRIAVKDREKELDELFIKNVSIEYDKKPFETPKIPKEPVVKEAPGEKKKTAEQQVPDKQPELVKKTEKKGVKEVKEEKATQKVEIHEVSEKQKEPAKTKSGKATKKGDLGKEEEAEHPSAGIITEPEGKEARPKADIKIVGKLDLKSLDKKPKKKTRGKEAVEQIEEKTESSEESGILIAEPAEIEEILSAIEPEEIVVLPEELPEEDNFIRTQRIILEGPTILGSIKLPEPKKFEKKKPVASSSDETLKGKKKKRKRIRKQPGTGEAGTVEPRTEHTRPKFREKKIHREILKPELTAEDIARQIKETLARLGPVGKSKASKYRRLKRELVSQQMQEETSPITDQDSLCNLETGCYHQQPSEERH